MSTKKTSIAEPPSCATSPDDGLFWETRVADSLGVARDRLRVLREEHMVENTHYIRRRNAVVLTETGMELITRLLDLSPASPPRTTEPAPIDRPISPEKKSPAPSPAPFAPPVGPAPRVNVRVTKVPPNRRLLFCTPSAIQEGTSAQFLVRVKTNENFMAGMTMDVISAGSGTYQYVGRLPRRKGRW